METQIAAAEIGQFVRQRRNAANLTQRQLAEIAGVGQRFISELERGKATLRLSEVDSVLAVFGKQLGIVDRAQEQDDESQ
jgi:y4mF family transcriptional regulator